MTSIGGDEAIREDACPVAERGARSPDSGRGFTSPSKLVPVQVPPEWERPRVKTTVKARYAEYAYVEYAARYGTDQSLERMYERGGFGATEIMLLLCDRIDRLEKRLVKLRSAPIMKTIHKNGEPNGPRQCY